jgi:hypothetical protein
LHSPNAGKHMQNLAKRMCVPGGTGARLESDGMYAQRRRRRPDRDFVEPHRACEPLRAPGLACPFGIEDNLHGRYIAVENVRFQGRDLRDLAAAVPIQLATGQHVPDRGVVAEQSVGAEI